MIPFRSARAAFGAILSGLQIGDGTVLLPAYIGWSPREGSGVFDPVAQLNLSYGFYAVDEFLRVDIESLRTLLEAGGVSVVVLIHYFGCVDPLYADAVEVAKKFGAFVLEDEAHALLSDVVTGACGRLGDACIYSFHKMLPVPLGGAAIINDPASPLLGVLTPDPESTVNLYDYDLHRIARRRSDNAQLLSQLLSRFVPQIRQLRDEATSRGIPQSFPVRVPAGLRDRLYFEMNAAGFGVVSLYHTLIPQISRERFPAAFNVSRQILNLPVHQDVSGEALELMVHDLAARIRRNCG
jgi:dTDP-4-amino-4,6-dideoxygalactose transaminase